ncbi:MAG: hypothetical protein IID43_04385 [Planctomycetes bacterium]|nr:hypothetical protein [Planctomycetota bacterium]
MPLLSSSDLWGSRAGRPNVTLLKSPGAPGAPIAISAQPVESPLTEH